MATQSIVPRRDLANNLILLATVFAVILYIARPSPEMRKGSDFAEAYAAAQMVRQGQGHQLYDPVAQYQFQSHYLGRVGSYYLHAPFELVPYLLLTGLSLQHAFFFWSLCNGIILVAAARVLSRHLFADLNWRVMTGLFLVFVPVLLNFLQGQDSLLLLLILALAFVAIHLKREFSAGCLMACGLFKFHLIFPLVFIVGFSFIRKWKFFAGFVLVAVLLTIISLAICGWRLFASYPQLILQLKDLPLAGVDMREMANFRGLFTLLSPGHSFAALMATVISSISLLWTVIGEWRKDVTSDDKFMGLTFANSIIAAVMVGYHLSPNDLTLLLLPMSLITCHVLGDLEMTLWHRYGIIITQLILFLPPLHVFLLRKHIYGYAAIPVLALFVATHLAIKKASVR